MQNSTQHHLDGYFLSRIVINLEQYYASESNNQEEHEPLRITNNTPVELPSTHTHANNGFQLAGTLHTHIHIHVSAW